MRCGIGHVCVDFSYLLCMYIDETIPGGRQSFSSYPGVLLSMDDYYLIGSKLVGTVLLQLTFDHSPIAVHDQFTPDYM